MTPEELIKQARQRFYREFPALRPKQPQPVPEEGRLVLGRDKHGLPFALDTRLLSAHIDMVGGIGGGKSSAMRHLAWLNMETHPTLNRATIIIDPHGLARRQSVSHHAAANRCRPASTSAKGSSSSIQTASFAPG